MAEGDGWGGPSCARSNHPALASASTAPPYPRRGAFAGTYVAVYSSERYGLLRDRTATEYSRRGSQTRAQSGMSLTV